MSRIAPLRWVVKAYIEVIRGTPLLLQLIYVYYVLPEIGIRLDAFTAGVLALTLNYSAYISEVYRGGIQAIPRGQHDAAAALGMTHGLAMRRIVLPQAIRIIIPTLGNYFIGLFKDTALCFGRKHPGAGVHRTDPRRAELPVFHAVHRGRGRCISRSASRPRAWSATSSASPARATGGGGHDRPSPAGQ